MTPGLRDGLSLITSRHCKRAFLDRVVPRDALAEIFLAAGHAPSSRNTQMWQVTVATGSALEALGPGDAFVTLEERGLGVPDGAADFPARPARFGAALGGPSEAGACASGAHFADHWFGFSDGGRHFHVLVAFGPQASAEVQRQAWAILDGLRVDPGVVPDWQSSG